jgi:hypothetical protein
VHPVIDGDDEGVARPRAVAGEIHEVPLDERVDYLMQ